MVENYDILCEKYKIKLAMVEIDDNDGQRLVEMSRVMYKTCNSLGQFGNKGTFHFSLIRMSYLS